jgi:hypothetical protein
MAKVDETAEFSDEEIDHGAEKDFLAALRHGPDVQVSTGFITLPQCAAHREGKSVHATGQSRSWAHPRLALTCSAGPLYHLPLPL